MSAIVIEIDSTAVAAGRRAAADRHVMDIRLGVLDADAAAAGAGLTAAQLQAPDVIDAALGSSCTAAQEDPSAHRLCGAFLDLTACDLKRVHVALRCRIVSILGGSVVDTAAVRI